jgi:hypothetical protein
LLWLISQPSDAFMTVWDSRPADQQLRAGVSGVVAGRRARATTGSDSDLLVSVAATAVTIIPIVAIIVVDALLVMIVTAIVYRPQEVIEDMRRDASPLPPRRCVRAS